MKAFKQASTSIRRSPYQALAATVVLFLTFFVGYSLTLFLLGSAQILQYFETRPQVTAFFKQGTSVSELQSYQQQLQNESYVKEVRLVTQDQALEIYQQQTQSEPLMQELVTADILPPSLEISTNTINDLAKAAELVNGFDQVDEVVYHEEVVQTLRYWTNSLRQVGIAILVVFIGTSLLVVIIITGMRIASKKYETRVMRLMGATKWYIMRPFLLEGMIYGLVGSSLSFLVVYLLLLYATPAVQRFFGEIQLLPAPWEVMTIIWVGGTLGAMLLGLLASFISSRRLFQV